MSIIGHTFDKDGQIRFLIKTRDHPWTESLTPKQTLALQQEQLSLYRYFSQTDSHNKSDKLKSLPTKVNSMILDYVDVGHMQAAIELIESCIAVHLLPSSQVTLLLMDILLGANEITNKRQFKEQITQQQQAHSLLWQIMEAFGVDTLYPLWSKLQHENIESLRKTRSTSANSAYQRQCYSHHQHNLHQRQRQRQDRQHQFRPQGSPEYTYYSSEEVDEEDEMEHGTALGQFEDFWHLALYCFTAPIQDTSATNLGYRLALDFFIQMLFMDIQSRRYQLDALSECLLLGTIPLNSYKERTQLGRYLDVIFSGFDGEQLTQFGLPSLSPSLQDSSSSVPSSPESWATQGSVSPATRSHLHVENINHAMKLLNMLVALCYSEPHLLTSAELINQTYRRIMNLPVDHLDTILQNISNVTFVLGICELYFQDSDGSFVDSDDQYLKWATDDMSRKKMIRFVMKTGPRRPTTMKSLYRHCVMVMRLWTACIHATSYRCDSTSPTQIVTIDKDNNASILTLDDMVQWRRHITRLGESIDEDQSSVWESKLDYIFETMEFSLVS